MRFAIIEAGKVVNIAEAEPAFAAKQGWVAVQPGVNIGDTYDGEFTPPEPEPSTPPPVPTSVTRRQAKLALLAVGKLEDAEDELAEAGRAAQIEWADALTFERDNALIVAVGHAIGLDDDGIDDLFRAAVLL